MCARFSGVQTCQRHDKVNAWICAPATERDLESFSAMEVNVWICALATDRVSGFIFKTVFLNKVQSKGPFMNHQNSIHTRTDS